MDNEYENATPLDWAKYELASVYCDFRLDPRAAATIEHIVETLYKETMNAKNSKEGADNEL